MLCKLKMLKKIILLYICYMPYYVHKSAKYYIRNTKMF